MARFRKRPIVVEAFVWNPEGKDAPAWFFEACQARKCYPEFDGLLTIHTNEGTMTAEPGDWVIKEPFPTTDRELYPCNPDIFEATYELVEEHAPASASAGEVF